MAGGIAMSVSPESGEKKAAQCCHIAPDEGVAWVGGGGLRHGLVGQQVHGLVLAHPAGEEVVPKREMSDISHLR